MRNRRNFPRAPQRGAVLHEAAILVGCLAVAGVLALDGWGRGMGTAIGGDARATAPSPSVGVTAQAGMAEVFVKVARAALSEQELGRVLSAPALSEVAEPIRRYALAAGNAESEYRDASTALAAAGTSVRNGFIDQMSETGAWGTHGPYASSMYKSIWALANNGAFDEALEMVRGYRAHKPWLVDASLGRIARGQAKFGLDIAAVETLRRITDPEARAVSTVEAIEAAADADRYSRPLRDALDEALSSTRQDVSHEVDRWLHQRVSLATERPRILRDGLRRSDMDRLLQGVGWRGTGMPPNPRTAALVVYTIAEAGDPTAVRLIEATRQSLEAQIEAGTAVDADGTLRILARAEARAGLVEEALATAERATDKREGWLTRQAVAIELVQTGNSERAREIAEGAGKLPFAGPVGTSTHNMLTPLALELARTGDHAKAAEWFDTSIESASRAREETDFLRAEELVGIARLMIETGSPHSERGVRIIEEALARADVRGRLRVALADALLLMGDRKRAMTLIDESTWADVERRLPTVRESAFATTTDVPRYAERRRFNDLEAVPIGSRHFAGAEASLETLEAGYRNGSGDLSAWIGDDAQTYLESEVLPILRATIADTEPNTWLRVLSSEREAEIVARIVQGDVKGARDLTDEISRSVPFRTRNDIQEVVRFAARLFVPAAEPGTGVFSRLTRNEAVDLIRIRERATGDRLRARGGGAESIADLVETAQEGNFFRKPGRTIDQELDILDDWLRAAGMGDSASFERAVREAEKVFSELPDGFAERIREALDAFTKEPPRN